MWHPKGQSRPRNDFPLLPVTFGEFQGLAETMLCHYLIPHSMTFAEMTSPDCTSIRDKTAYITSYNLIAKCMIIQKAYVSVIDYGENGKRHLLPYDFFAHRGFEGNHELFNPLKPSPFLAYRFLLPLPTLVHH